MFYISVTDVSNKRISFMVNQSTRINKEIKHANSSRYNNLHEVEGYLQEPYHSLRISLGISLLHESLKMGKKRDKKKILELASSTGKVARKIKELINCHLVASDIEYTPLHFADKSYMECVQLDASSKLPFHDESFDGIFMGELLEHVFDPLQVLQECYRILRHDGLLLITTPNLAALQDRIEFLFGKSPRHINPLHEYLYLHIRPFTFRLLSLTLQKSGFSVKKLQSNIVRIRFSSGKHIDSRWLAKIFPALGGSLIVLAQKKFHKNLVF